MQTDINKLKEHLLNLQMRLIKEHRKEYRNPIDKSSIANLDFSEELAILSEALIAAHQLQHRTQEIAVSLGNIQAQIRTEPEWKKLWRDPTAGAIDGSVSDPEVIPEEKLPEFKPSPNDAVLVYDIVFKAGVVIRMHNGRYVVAVGMDTITVDKVFPFNGFMVGSLPLIKI